MTRDIRAILELKKGSEICNGIVVLFSMGLAIILNVILADSGVDFKALTMILVGAGVGGYMTVNSFVKIFMLAEETPRGLAFGMTRRKLFLLSRAVDLVEILILAILSVVLLRDINAGLIFKMAAAAFGFFMWLEGLAGNNVVRYGKIAYWIYYICFMLVMFGVPRLIGAIPGVADAWARFFDGFTNSVYSQGPIWIGLLVFILLGILVNWLTFRTLAVNYNV